VEHLSKCRKRFLDVFALHRTNLEELEADLMRECLSVMGLDLLAGIQICLV